jgi:tetratricopeptide (TPR) repeat protein
MLKLTSPSNRSVIIGILVVLLSSPMVISAQGTNDRYLDGELLQRATRLALEEYRRAVEYGLSAERIQPPTNRAAEYERMLRSVNDALQLYNVIEDKPEVYHNIPKLLARFWAAEYNAGVNIINDDSVRQTLQNPFESAKAHLENAILIQPDSAIAYAALSSLHLQMQDTSAAIAWYEEALERKKEIKISDYDVLIDLYFAENRLEDAVALSLKTREDYPEETGFIRILADVYLALGESEKAVSMIRELTEIEPDNARYHNIIASVVYQTADIYLEEAREMYIRAEELKSEVQQLSGFERRRHTENISDLETAAEEKEMEGERLIDVAIEDYKKVLEIEPQNEEVLIMLGIIYQNKAVDLFEKHDNAENRMQAIEYDENARMTLATAMDYYERAAELNPDNMDYWEVLYHIYLELGMGVKLENAMDKLGI